jgi:chemotaxis protein CheD
VPAAALPVAEALKYVDTAIELMLMAFATRGVTTQEIEVKLFGGADSLGADVPAGGYCVGSRNIEAALAVLAQRGIVPVAGGVGGRHGRVIDFDTASGEVHVRRLPSRSEGGRT